MKKLYTLLLLIFSSALVAQGSDSFLYTGALKDNGWGSQSGIAGQVITSSGSLSYPGITSLGNKTQVVAGNTEDINLPSTTPLSGVAYYSALINFPNVTGLSSNTTTGNYLLMFGSLSTAVPPTYTTFNGRLYIKTGGAPNTFSLGILNGAGGTAAPTYSTTDYNINTTYMIVVKFNFTTNTASLFINPTFGVPEGNPTVTNVTGTAVAPSQINGFIIREAGTAIAGTGNVQIDEVKFGSTWDSVISSTPSNSPNALDQSFCNSATVSDLVATGTSGATFSWYDVATGGTALTSSTALATGTYYVSQTVAGVESGRTAVVVTINNNVTPAPTATAQTFCGSKTVANLVATGTALKWYADTTTTTPLASTDAITTGTYYVSQTLNACESTRTSVAVTVNITAPPTATDQTFCGNKTVADLVATGALLRWYIALTGGTALATTTALTSGTYFVSQSLNACRSTRIPVVVTVNTTAAPTASAQTFCGSKTVADLVATGTALNWYTTNTSTTALVATTAITTGNYYVSQTLNACESSRTQVTVTVTVTALPTAAAQTFCGSKTGADLVATGTALKWYSDNTTTTVLTSTAVITTGTYYVTQTLNACESARKSVAVTVNITAPPTALAQTLCGSKTVADLVATGTALNWYATNTSTTALTATTAIATGTYYVSQSLNSCRSTRTSVAVTVNTTTAPTATAQTFCGSKTVGDLVANGTALKWYTTNTSTLAIPVSATIVSGTYYVSQTLNGCESSRTSVVVTVNQQPVINPLTYATVNTCGSYTLPYPVGGIGTYWTGPNGSGTSIPVGTVFNNIDVPSYQVYVYAVSGTTPNCIDSKTLTINVFNVSEPQNVTDCGSHTLPTLTYGSYFTPTGIPITNQTITASQNIIVSHPAPSTIDPSGTCTDSHSFYITIINQPNYFSAPLAMRTFCDTDGVNDGYYAVNLTALNSAILGPNQIEDTNGGVFHVRYYATLADANNPSIANELVSPHVVTSGVPVYVRIDNISVTSQCSQINPINYIINNTPAPTGLANQTFVYGQTIADIVVTGTGINWYLGVGGTGMLLNPNELLVNGATYYTTQTLNGCTSTSSLSVTVTLTLATDSFDTINFNYSPNPTSGILNVSYNKEISEINVVTIVGQTVLTKQTNTKEVQIDLSALADATYFVKIVSDGNTKTIKVVKSK